MGHTADLALGIALAQPGRKVICLNGDGSMLMALGTLAAIVEADARNLILFVVQNDTYEITGNQPIPAAGRIDFAAVALGTGFRRVYAFDDASMYEQQLPEILSADGPVFVAVRVERGCERPLARSRLEQAEYLQPSIAESAHSLRKLLCESDEA
jgi:thiamine pyrophosphate-dependent acetolactate synthase large subunit-like protein